MGIDGRDHIHEIEFLSLVAFIARERQRLARDLLPDSKFTHNDLAMAYAFQNQFSQRKHQQQLFQKQHQQQLFQEQLSAENIPQTKRTSSLPQAHNTAGLTKSATVDCPLSHYQPAAVTNSPEAINSTLHPIIQSASADHVPVDQPSGQIHCKLKQEIMHRSCKA